MLGLRHRTGLHKRESNAPTALHDKPLAVEMLARTNRNVGRERIKEARELIWILRSDSMSGQGYELAPPLRHQVASRDGCS